MINNKEITPVWPTGGQLVRLRRSNATEFDSGDAGRQGQRQRIIGIAPTHQRTRPPRPSERLRKRKTTHRMPGTDRRAGIGTKNSKAGFRFHDKQLKKCNRSPV
jgi:hypothetical protein